MAPLVNYLNYTIFNKSSISLSLALSLKIDNRRKKRKRKKSKKTYFSFDLVTAESKTKKRSTLTHRNGRSGAPGGAEHRSAQSGNWIIRGDHRLGRLQLWVYWFDTRALGMCTPFFDVNFWRLRLADLSSTRYCVYQNLNYIFMPSLYISIYVNWLDGLTSEKSNGSCMEKWCHSYCVSLKSGI